MADMNPVTWPGWEIVRKIGSGSFGAVYEIQRNTFGNIEKAALKVITIPRDSSEIEDLYSDGYDGASITARFHSYLEDIIKEYALMVDIKGHTNVVYCDDFKYIQHDDGIGWDILIKMELLTALTKTLGKEIDESTAVRLGIDICKALVLCKSRNIVHRDIKPQNIFVSRDGNYKLGDFGIAKVADRTASGTKAGTFKYMAPEVYKGEPYAAGADIYSLGIVLYWMLNERRTPFLPLPPQVPTANQEAEACRRRFMGEPLPAPLHGGAMLKEIVLKACAYAPKDRFSSAAEMLDALQMYAAETAMVTNTASVVVPASGAVVSSCAPQAPYAPQEASVTEIIQSPSVTEPYERSVTVMATADETVAMMSGKRRVQMRQDASGNWYMVDVTATGNSAPSTAAVPQQMQSSPVPTVPRKKGNPIAVACLALCLIGGALTVWKPWLSDPSDGQVSQTVPSESREEAISKPENAEDEPKQSVWSDWTTVLPASVTSSKYEIEEQTLYRSRELETTSSTSQSSMPGWELYDTVDSSGDWGRWSDWSANTASTSSNRQVETQTRYRYRDKETTTSSSSSLNGWDLYDTTYSWGDWGGWSDWSEDTVSSRENRDVEKKTQYRYRSVTISQEYSSWSDWSNWSTNSINTSNTCQVESSPFYRYYYFLCHGCGDHNPFSSPCGCGSKSNSWDEKWSPISYGSSSSSAISYTSAKRQTTSLGDGQLWYFSSGNLNDTAIGTRDSGGADIIIKERYRYRTRTLEDVTSYGAWSSWRDKEYLETDEREVEKRTMYRYRERERIPTYHFSRWGGWSSWSATAISATNSREVETTTYYRYRDKVTQKTYYFKRWTEWSDYSTAQLTASNTLQVESIVQYRFKSKS